MININLSKYCRGLLGYFVKENIHTEHIAKSIYRGIYCAFQSFFSPPLSEESFFFPTT